MEPTHETEVSNSTKSNGTVTHASGAAHDNNCNSTDNETAQLYLDHLLNDGGNEGDSGYEMQMPEYYDETLFKKAQNYMNKYRFVIQSGMLAGLVAVLAIPSILKVLICTRQSSKPETAYRRYLRTIMHTNAWYDYSPTPENSKFWISLRAVRKAHSKSSRACAKLGAGQVTQKDLALTQFGFIGLLSLGAHRIQMHDEEFLEATSHMWRVLGYLLGLKDEYNICGENWAQTKLRLDIVMRKVYEPALANTSKEFEEMCTALLDGLWPINTSLSTGSFLFMTKRLAYVKGYEYYDFDYRPGCKPDPQQHSYYKDLSWWDRFVVSFSLFMVTYLHKYALVRWYLNLRVLLAHHLAYYLPMIAIFKYGLRQSYIRIFTESGKENDFEYHLKSE